MKKYIVLLCLSVLFFTGYVYAACISGNCENGQGTSTYGGNKYVGEFKNGKMEGQGTYTFANGDKYVGEFKDGKMEGQGTYTYVNGSKDVGEFKNGKFVGK